MLRLSRLGACWKTGVFQVDIFAIELRPGNTKIEYADGSREEIEAGIYERKNSVGETVQQRRATAADIARLTTLATDFEAANSATSAVVTRVDVLGTSIEVTYDDGTKEEISGGIYERKNAANKTIIERVATSSDTQRLNNLANGGTPASGSDDGTPDQGSGDVGVTTPGSDDGTPDQGSGDVGVTTPGSDDGTPDQGSGDVGTGTGTPPDLTLNGTNAAERMHGRSKAEHISGFGGDDDIRARAGNDLVDGGSGDDRIRGDRGDDTVFGGSGDDTLRGDLGDDLVQGGDGDDNVRGDGGNDTVDGGIGDDILRGDAGNDLLRGGDGKDRLKGGGGDDTLEGGNGNDRLFGGRGNDTLEGGEGRDTYDGGLGSDVFVFSRDGSLDKIADFASGTDIIDLSAYGLAGFDAVLDLASQRNGDTLLNFGGGDILRIDDVRLADLDASDFIL
jgi:Ca2+-binding RTX toxin-like protein